MRITRFLLLLSYALLATLSCTSNKNSAIQNTQYFELPSGTAQDTLFRFSRGEYELGEEFGYINQKGDTIVSLNQFANSFSDTITSFGIVTERLEEKINIVGINTLGQRLYEIYWFDNGPDYISDGLFRIMRNNKIGYADSTGKIVIMPEYDCAFPFENGEAKVSDNCDLEISEDYTIPKSDSWIFINKRGEKVR